MKTRGTIEATANLIYGKQIYQKAQKLNTVVVDATPTVFDTVQLDCNNGNIQSIDLSAASTNVIVKLTNLNLGTYVFVLKQHATTCKSVSFQPALTSSFDMLTIGTNQYATVVLTWDGTTLRSDSTTSIVTPYSSTISYGIGALVIHENSIYKSLVQVPVETFAPAKWQALSSSEASSITYADTYGTGSTNLQSVVDYLVNAPYIDFKRYASIDSMIADITSQKDSAIYLVDNVAIGTMRDGRATSGFAYYTRIALAANITSYNIVGQFSEPATRTSFDNTIAGIPNNPTNVKTAIDELSRLVDATSAGQRYVGTWDATVNGRFLADNAYYDDLTKNPVIDLYSAGTKQATVLTANWPSTLTTGHKIRIVNATTSAIIHETTISTITLSGLNTIITLTTDTGVLQGHKIITANKRATSGEYFIVSTAGTKTLDGKSVWALNDRVMSNGLTWDRLIYNTTPSITDVPTDNIIYGRKNGAWEAVPSITIDTVLNGTSTNAIENRAVKLALDTKLSDAPNDNKIYGRRNNTWTEVIDSSNISEYTYAMSSDAYGNMTMHVVSGDGSFLISKPLDLAFIGSTILAKDSGFALDFLVIEDKLVIQFADFNTFEMKFLILEKFKVDEFNNTFTATTKTVVSTGSILTQYKDVTLIHHIDSIYIMQSNTPSRISRYSTHDFKLLADFVFPNHNDWNNASNAQIFGTNIIFTSGTNTYTGFCSVSRISLDFSSYAKMFDANPNGSTSSIPGTSMYIVDGFLYMLNPTYNATSFKILKYDIREITAPVLVQNQSHNYTGGNNIGFVYRFVVYSDMMYVGINWIGGLPSNADKQLWSIRLSDLSVYQKLTIADYSNLISVSSAGRLIYATSDSGFIGNSDAKLYSINAVDFSQPPVVLLDIPTTTTFNGLSQRKTSKDVLRQNGYIPYKNPSTIAVTGSLGDTLYHNGTTWIKATETSAYQNGTGINTITLVDTPIASTLKIYRNGIKERVGVDYTISGNVITFLTNIPVSTTTSIESIYLKL